MKCKGPSFLIVQFVICGGISFARIRSVSGKSKHRVHWGMRSNRRHTWKFWKILENIWKTVSLSFK
jgi:hypothetical protein